MAIPLLLLLLALTPLSQSKVFVSIDCGSDLESYVDENSIKWVGDGTLMTDGESHEVETLSASHVMKTLRAFTDGEQNDKHCYAIEAEKDTQVLLRASFLYGNYDGNSSPPSFALQADGNHWETVRFDEEDHDLPVVYEAIYVVRADYISVCVAQTEPDRFPFVSAIEARSLGSKMYPYVDATFALLTRQMVAYGSSTSIRYPDDPYDREWIPESIDHGYSKVTNEAESIRINVTDNPPEAIFHNAVTTSSTSEPLILSTSITLDDFPIYMNMYFSEVTSLKSTEKRSFVFTIDGKIASEPIIPPYGSVLQMYLTNTTASPNTTYALVATEDSTLPPLINAMEVFYVAGPLTEGTNDKDWEALVSLQEKYSVLQDSSGDPCLPSPFTWNWVNCSSDDRPRITALYLSGYALTGPIPDFSSLDALEIIDMHNNSLTGSIPNFFGNLPKLKELDLADNKLSGSIPTSLSNNSNVKLYASGNPLCTSSKSSACSRKNRSTIGSSKSSGSVQRKSNKFAVILGAIVSSFFVFF